MKPRALACTLGLLFAAAGIAQAPGEYLDVLVVKVKPEKRAEFDAVMKKVVDINRHNKGDVWIASETIYGEWNTVYLTTQRASYGEMEQGLDAFFGSLARALGPAGAAKLFQDYNNCIVSGRGEARRRRLDLSSLTAADAERATRQIGQLRWTRTTVVRIRPGRADKFEELLKLFKAAWDRNQLTRYVSQSASGQQGIVYYITALGKSMAEFDGATGVQQLLGSAGYQTYLSTSAEAVLSNEAYINRVLPELSNPPEAIAALDPAFWRPKPPAPVEKKATPKKKE
ncbi:MAG: hypothetical protein HYR60_00635 [Acidobacteria bacterium]|nr:hypothetical protein [Acidobacteriota bacterium]